jgi:putative Ca2+/H+ antiporter (TMEM165/GDT1 family)
VLVFVAELGDKSQLLAVSLGARHRVLPLMSGAILAFAATSLISATAGGLIATTVPTSVIAYVSGLVFLGFGLWMLWPVVRHSAASEARDLASDELTPISAGLDHPDHASWWRVFTLAFVAMFLAEFGDKTMLVSAALAARSNVVVVWLGATIAITLSTLIGVSLGRYLTGKISERNLKIGSAALFVAVGTVMILSGMRA